MRRLPKEPPPSVNSWVCLAPNLFMVSETQDIVMDSACNLINFYNDVDDIMPMGDIKISPSCCSNYEDGFTLNEGALMYRKGLDLDPDPMVVDTQGPVLTSPEFLRPFGI
jgi:hypothetical protein